MSEASNSIELITNAKEKQKKELKSHPQNIKILIKHIHFGRSIRLIKKTVKLHVGYVQETIKYPTTKTKE